MKGFAVVSFIRMAGLEPAASPSPTEYSYQTELHPVCGSIFVVTVNQRYLATRSRTWASRSQSGYATVTL